MQCGTISGPHDIFLYLYALILLSARFSYVTKSRSAAKMMAIALRSGAAATHTRTWYEWVGLLTVCVDMTGGEWVVLRCAGGAECTLVEGNLS